MKQLILTIHGKVQGVNFRSFVADMADELGLVGYVKNNEEGTVTVFAQGQEDALQDLWDHCAIGPEFASVTEVEEQWSDIEEKTFDEFEIRR